MRALRDFVVEPSSAATRAAHGVPEQLGWPLPPAAFGPTMWRLLQANSELARANLVGFTNDSHTQARARPRG
eukprot:2386933-Prymnesium_polylepis.1